MSSVTLDVAVGKPHEEILWTADRLKCDVIVMGAHGRTGTDKLMMGSTTHRILRRSALPVLATPPVSGRARGPANGWPGKIAIAPVDVGIRDRADALAAAAVARELGTQLELVHVVEPISSPPWLEVDADRRNLQRQSRAIARLTQLQDELKGVVTAVRVEFGGPADEIAKIASSRHVGLVVMTRRRGQGLFGPRQGSISYRCCVKPTRRCWRSRATNRGYGASHGGGHENQDEDCHRSIHDRRIEHRHVGGSGNDGATEQGDASHAQITRSTTDVGPDIDAARHPFQEMRRLERMEYRVRTRRIEVPGRRRLSLRQVQARHPCVLRLDRGGPTRATDLAPAVP